MFMLLHLQVAKEKTDKGPAVESVLRHQVLSEPQMLLGRLLEDVGQLCNCQKQSTSSNFKETPSMPF